MKKKKIQMAVIFYGDDSQKITNEQQFKYLRQELRDFVIKKYDFKKNGQDILWQDFQKGKVDVVLKNAYGRGHEATIEAWLELKNIPFFGSGSLSTFVATSKSASKKIFRECRLLVVKDVFVGGSLWVKGRMKILRQVEDQIGFPCIIKDTTGTDSRGIYLVESKDELEPKLEKAMSRHESVIVEEYISNAKEITCFVVGNDQPKAYEPVGMADDGAMLSGIQKDKLLFTPTIPVAVSQKIRNQIKKISVLAHQALRCQTFSRADFLIKDGKIYLLEVDVHPGFRHKSATILSAKHQGQSPNDLFLMFFKKYARTPTLR